jgi:hypothetical protein
MDELLKSLPEVSDQKHTFNGLSPTRNPTSLIEGTHFMYVN